MKSITTIALLHSHKASMVKISIPNNTTPHSPPNLGGNAKGRGGISGIHSTQNIHG